MFSLFRLLPGPPRAASTQLALLLAFLAALPSGLRAQQLTTKTLTYQGVKRTWYEHVPPSYTGTARVPLVIALHGYSNSGDKFAAINEWPGLGDQNNFISVFPNGGLIVGSDFGWNAYHFDGNQPDDVGFLAVLIQKVKTTYKIDGSRIYLVGFSNGGDLASNFCGLHASTLAAASAVSGAWLTSQGFPESAMQPDASLPFWVWRGAKENFMDGSEPLATQDRKQTLFWANFDGDGTTPQTVKQAPYTTQIYTGGRAEVRYTSIANADHGYQPGTSAQLWNNFFSRSKRTTTAATPTPTPQPTATPTPTPPAATPTPTPVLPPPTPTPTPPPGSTPTPTPVPLPPTPTPPPGGTPPPTPITTPVPPPDDGSTPTPTPVPSPPPGTPVISVSADRPQALRQARKTGSFVVTRAADDLSAPLLVFYTVRGGAVGGTDYKTLHGRVRIKPGQASARIKIRPLPGPTQNVTRTVRLVLAPGSNYTLGDVQAARVRIVENE